MAMLTRPGLGPDLALIALTLAQVVQVRQRDPRQPLIANFPEQIEGTLHEELLGSQPRQGAVQAIGMGEQERVSARVGARKTCARAPVALDESALFTTPFDSRVSCWRE